jgi:hypothetical protein
LRRQQQWRLGREPDLIVIYSHADVDFVTAHINILSSFIRHHHDITPFRQ